MKAIVVSMIAAGLLFTESAMATEPAGIDTGPVVKMPEVATKNNCIVCHAIYRRLVGPGWLDVSKKYKGQTKYTYAGTEYPLLEGLMMKVSKGGAGNWGAMPMIASDAAGTKQADIKELVTFVLGLDQAVAELNKTELKKTEVKK